MKKDINILSSNRSNQLHIVMWIPERQSYKGILQISHGMLEHIDRYHRFAEAMTEQGYIVIGNDHLGHGKTAKDKDELGYMPSPDAAKDMVRDLYKVTLYAKKQFPNLPYYILGHSMGSFLVQRYLMLYGDCVDGAIIMGTGYQPRPLLLAGFTVLMFLHYIMGDKYRSLLVEKLMFCNYNRRIVSPKSPHAWLSRDEKAVEEYDHDTYCDFHFTVNGYKVLFDTLWYIEKKKNIDKIPKTLPILFVSGDADPVGGYKKGVQKVIAGYKEVGILQVDHIFYTDARHELLNEINYEKVQADIIEWLSFIEDKKR